MIKSESVVANKELRIWRPDCTLEEIRSSKGPEIVRTMVPCFDPKTKYPFSFVYGVVVRTPKTKDKVLPFYTAYKFNGTKGYYDDKFDPVLKYKVPDFTDEFKIRELLLSVSIEEDGSVKSENVNILSLTTDKKLGKNQIKNLKRKICREDSFFSSQIKGLELKNRGYLWITSEDYNVNTGGDALSNIIATTDDYDALVQFIMPHRLDFIKLLFLIKARYLFDAETAQLRTAIASAKAAIMSRNMSHNLGSHVMAYLKQHLSSVQDMVRDNVLDALFSPENTLTSDGLKQWWIDFEKKAQEQQEIALPFLVGLGKFISYLQERQDFIATIATDYVPYFSTVNFKDFIYDELNPDLRYLRHKDRIGLKPDNILLGNIARSEGIARSTNPTKGKNMTDIVIKYRRFNGRPVYNGDIGKEDLDDMREFMVQLPGGVVGRQAVFSIVENVIRNAAKHGRFAEETQNGNSTRKNLEITFNRYSQEDFDDKDLGKDFVPKGEDDFRTFYNKYYASASDIDDLYIITLTDNLSFEENGSKINDCKKLETLRQALIEQYVDKVSTQMLQTNKGIKEMRISAAWLRGVDDDVKINPLYITPGFDAGKENADKEDFLIKSKDYWREGQWTGKAPVLMVRACADSEKEDYHLQYVFCLQKPKYVAYIIPDLLEDKESRKTWEKLNSIKKHLSKNSWGLYTISEFMALKNKSYEFIVLSKDIDEESVNRIKMVAPHRVVRYGEVEDIFPENVDGLLSNSFEDFTRLLTALYAKYCNFDPENDTIIISDEKAKNTENPPKNVTIQDGAYKAKYIYRTHNEIETQFNEYLKNAEPYTVFVEGITGNNSTDRLVRNNKIDELWMYKHLHAMKTSVGIFDERIFAKVFKKDETDIRTAEHLKSLETLKEKQKSLYDILKDSSFRKADENAIDKYIRKNMRGDYLSIAYSLKGVSVFNILKTNEGLDIYGYGGYGQENDRYFGNIEKVAEIRKGNGVFQIKKFKEIRFDLISIHQGLLDKIYEQFDIKNDARAKHEFTRAFYENFCTNTDIIRYIDDSIDNGKKEVYYLPNLRIHSGRSKPSYADMPQRQPFIQYAAIENAIMDCKYSLIELLDFARYE